MKVSVVLLIQTKSKSRREAILQYLGDDTSFDAIFTINAATTTYNVQRIYKMFNAQSYLFLTWSQPFQDDLLIRHTDFGPLPYSLQQDELLVLSVPHLFLRQGLKASPAALIKQTILELVHQRKIQAQSLYYQHNKHQFEYIQGIDSLETGHDIKIYQQVMSSRFQTFLLRTEAKLAKIMIQLRRVIRRELTKDSVVEDEYALLKQFQYQNLRQIQLQPGYIAFQQNSVQFMNEITRECVGATQVKLPSKKQLQKLKLHYEDLLKDV